MTTSPFTPSDHVHTDQCHDVDHHEQQTRQEPPAENASDAPDPCEAAVDAEKAVQRHVAKSTGFFFKKPGQFEISPETWDIEELEKKENDILAYFLNGPDPFDSTFIYKKAVVEYLRRRFPGDKPVRDIIDVTTKSINDNNRRYVWFRKIMMIAFPTMALVGFASSGAFQLSAHGVVAAAFLASGVLLFMLSELLRSFFRSTIDEIGKDFHSAFQQFSNVVFNNFKESLYRVDQDEHTIAVTQWPARARRRMVASLWQSKRVEYAEKYLMVALHTAKNGLRGMFGSDLMGNIINSASVFIIGLVSMSVLYGYGVITPGSNEASGFMSMSIIVSIVLVVIMGMWLFSYFARNRFGDNPAIKVWNALDNILTWGLIALIALYDIAILGNILNTNMQLLTVGQLLAVNVGALILLSFKSSVHFSILDQSIDASKWRKAESFSLHQEVGEQIYRDKCRIVEEKHRQKRFKHEAYEFRQLG